MSYIDDELSLMHAAREQAKTREKDWLAQAHEIAVICVDFSTRFLAHARSIDPFKPWTTFWQNEGQPIYLDIPVRPRTDDELRAEASGYRRFVNEKRYHWWEKMSAAEALRDVTRRHQAERAAGAQTPTWVLHVGYSETQCSNCVARFTPASTVSEVDRAITSTMRHTVADGHYPYLLAPESVGRGAVRALLAAGYSSHQG